MIDFTVVIPLYNKGPHIERALASVAAQTRKASQVIVVDDGSTDGGYEYVEALDWPDLLLDRRTTPGPGGYAARNRGIELATGNWVAWLDADDEWLPDHLETLAAAIERHGATDDAAIVFGGYQNIWPDGRRTVDPYSDKVGGGDIRMTFAQLLDHWIGLNDCPVWTSATACRTAALRQAEGFPEARCRRGGDKDTWLRVADLGDAVYSGKVTARYFRDSVNMTTRNKYANTVPCIVASADAIRANADTSTASRMTRLINREIFNYALVSARTEGLDPRSWAAFDHAAEPGRGIALRFLSSPAGVGAARLAYALRSRLRRNKTQ